MIPNLLFYQENGKDRKSGRCVEYFFNSKSFFIRFLFKLINLDFTKPKHQLDERKDLKCSNLFFSFKLMFVKNELRNKRISTDQWLLKRQNINMLLISLNNLGF